MPGTASFERQGSEQPKGDAICSSGTEQALGLGLKGFLVHPVPCVRLLRQQQPDRREFVPFGLGTQAAA